ncbi:TauD/TfdA family dioxygenase [Actinospica durhamensis]|uniref:TauD/TfdA family dioxygenase n=1 Tax=Actinospica durhamensis TaxID=1508375 RepID=A0A941INR1_9ACTN|nr:TauD/TfdA family dioxygenase [Actinospica durhamensis]MBR7834254.1 TauD/TfdA family dioxygenase [Actinospica durhamensis]
MFTVESLGTASAGKVMRAVDGRTNVRDLPLEAVAELCRESGAVLLRGFGSEPGDFAAFTDRFSSSTLGRLHLAQNRREVADDKSTSTVNLGMQLVGPHAELGYSPQRPDLLWFSCVRPSADGGQTTLFDGIKAWERLPDPLREKFATTDLLYSFEAAGRDDWPLFTGVPADRARTLELLAAERGVSYTIGDEETIDINYRVPAAGLSRFQGVPAFSNSIVPSLSDGVSFADGTPLRSGDGLSILRVCDDLMTPVDWQKGDILMIDNSRMMHGRLPFSDPSREIHIRMTMAAF